MCAGPAPPPSLKARRPGARAKRGCPGPMNTMQAILLPVQGSGFAGRARAPERPAQRSCAENSAFQLAPALRQRAQAQRIEADESLRIVLVVGTRAVLERHEPLVVERIGAVAADHGGLALVELEAYPSGGELLAAIDRGLQHLALGREPEAVVDQLGIARHQLVLKMRRAAVERDLLDAAMGREQDRAARRLVHAARLHADEAVLDEVEPADAVLASELVEPRQEIGRREFLAVDRRRIAALELDGEIRRPVRRLLRIARARVDVIRDLGRRILQNFALG